MKHDYGPFAHSASIILFTFVASMIVLAGAEWSARRPEQPDVVPVEFEILPALPKPLE